MLFHTDTHGSTQGPTHIFHIASSWRQALSKGFTLLKTPPSIFIARRQQLPVKELRVGSQHSSITHGWGSHKATCSHVGSLASNKASAHAAASAKPSGPSPPKLTCSYTSWQHFCQRPLPKLTDNGQWGHASSTMNTEALTPPICCETPFP